MNRLRAALWAGTLLGVGVAIFACSSFDSAGASDTPDAGPDADLDAVADAAVDSSDATVDAGPLCGDPGRFAFCADFEGVSPPWKFDALFLDGADAAPPTTTVDVIGRTDAPSPANVLRAHVVSPGRTAIVAKLLPLASGKKAVFYFTLQATKLGTASGIGSLSFGTGRQMIVAFDAAGPALDVFDTDAVDGGQTFARHAFTQALPAGWSRIRMEADVSSGVASVYANDVLVVDSVTGLKVRSEATIALSAGAIALGASAEIDVTVDDVALEWR